METGCYIGVGPREMIMFFIMWPLSLVSNVQYKTHNYG